MVAGYLIETAQPATALRLLDQLPEEIAEGGLRHRLHILRGNAYMHIPGRVRDGELHFRRALAEAMTLTSADRHKFIAEAHKELGSYFMNTGQWQEADLSYRHARDVISATISAQRSAEDRDEMASIQTSWAYVKGLNGSYREGAELVESAITVRRRIGHTAEEGISWSVRGEVYRYARRFEKAWAAYSTAEQLLQGRRYWGWLGQIYQEQAICLYQALQDNIRLTAGSYSASVKATKTNICLRKFTCHNRTYHPGARSTLGWQATGWCVLAAQDTQGIATQAE